jgi:transcriptional regulator with XRE-family HTH domain
MEHPLRRYRERHQLSQDELAAASQTTKATISRIERGVRLPSWEMLKRIVAATGGELSANDFQPPPDGDEQPNSGSGPSEASGVPPEATSLDLAGAAQPCRPLSGGCSERGHGADRSGGEAVPLGISGGVHP